MKIHVVAFASVAETLGSRTTTLDCPEGLDVNGLLDLLEGSDSGFGSLRQRLAVAVDGRLAAADTVLHDGAEVALLPPVSGGRPRHSALLTRDPIDIEKVRLRVTDPSCGAQSLFLGCVRSEPDGPRVTHLTYEAYEPMATATLQAICSEIAASQPEVRIAIVHRLGDVPAGEPSVAIATSSPHRTAAFETNRTALERLKREVPIWKQEHFADGSATWREVEPLAGG